MKAKRNIKPGTTNHSENSQIMKQSGRGALGDKVQLAFEKSTKTMGNRWLDGWQTEE